MPRPKRAPSRQNILNLLTKTPVLGVQSPNSLSSQANMEDDTRPLLGHVDVDSLVGRITAEVLKGVEASFDKKIEPVLNKLEEYSSKITALDYRFTETEDRITSTTKLSDIEWKLDAAMEKTNELQNRSQRCNIHIVGLPEASQSTDPVAFFKAWLPEILKTSFKGGSAKLDRCHRALGRRPPPTSGCYHKAPQLPRQCFMQAAHKAQTLMYTGAKILIF